MKKLLLVFSLLLGGTVVESVYAGIPLQLILHIIDEDEASEGNTKAPMRPFAITLDENNLFFPATPIDYSLELRDESGAVVYTDYIPGGSTQIILPSWLEGEYDIRFVASTYYFIGYILL